MSNKTRDSQTTNPSTTAAESEPVIQERRPHRISEQIELVTADPTLLTTEQEKMLSDYAVRSGMTIEQARTELLARPRRPIK